MSSRLSFFIARRYFFSKKSHRVINIISLISGIGVAIGTAALIIILSVFNGFEDLILRLYNSFDPDLRIEKTIGKTFASDKINIDLLRKINGVAFVNPVIEESALAKYHDKQFIVKLKGVSSDYEKMTGLDTMIVQGNFLLQNGDTDYAIIGAGIAYNLGVDPDNIFNQVEIYGPKSGNGSTLDPEGAFNRRYISPSGIFAVQQEFDAKYIVTPIRFAREIFDYGNRLTAIEIGMSKNADEKQAIKNISQTIGTNFIVKNRFQMHELVYKIMSSERLAVFIILTFILIIAVFNVISSLTMLVIEKKKDIAIYQSMGAELSVLRKTFLIEGMMITAAGTFTGLIVGWFVCYLQQKFELIKLSGSGSFVIDAYPVKIVALDFLYVTITVICIGLLASWYPSRRLIRGEINLKAITEE